MASFSIVGPNEDNPDVISCLLHLFSMNTFYSQQKGIETLYSNLWDPASGKKLKMSILASRAFWISLIANILISKNRTVPTYIKKKYIWFTGTRLYFTKKRIFNNETEVFISWIFIRLILSQVIAFHSGIVTCKCFSKGVFPISTSFSVVLYFKCCHLNNYLEWSSFFAACQGSSACSKRKLFLNQLTCLL